MTPNPSGTPRREDPDEADPVRREDRRLLVGDGEYVDDLGEDALHLAFVRSQYGHATVESVDRSGATDREAVVAAYTWPDLGETPGKLPVGDLDAEVPAHPVLARERVRYQGQPVAAVVAEGRYAAHDAARAVDVEYDRRDAVVDPRSATEEASPTLFEAAPDNVVLTGEVGEEGATDRAFAAADRTVELDSTNNRLIPSAIEPRAALARPAADGERLVVEMTSQSPHGHRRKLSGTLGIPEDEIRVRSPDVGGGFGHKGHHHPGEAVAAWAALEVGRPVKWTATRSENYLAGAHGRDHRTRAALAFDDDGTLRAIRAETAANVGAYPLGVGPQIAVGYGRLLASQYRLGAVHCRTRAVVTNTAPVHSYRGAGRPEAIYVTERLLDRAARELDVDPAELRRRNQITGFPHETPAGATYDSGDYERALELALETVDYETLRDRQKRLRQQDRYLGVGLACYVESTGGGSECARVQITPDGEVLAAAGTHSHGQGHASTYAPLVATHLGVDPEAVAVREGDTDDLPRGTGTFGSRSTIAAGNGLEACARRVADRLQRSAADRLEADPEDLKLADGRVRVAGAPDRSIPLGELAATDGRDGIEETADYAPEGTAYTFGTHVAVVEVDPESGDLDLRRYLAVDDCGERLQPEIVEGQVHGGVAQGIGQAVYEAAEYDENGTLVTGSLQDYAVPDATQLPGIETDHTVTPSPTNPLGVKGIGEAGTVAAPPAVVNAAVDALEPFGVDHLEMPLTPERIWRATNDRRSGRR